MIDNRKLHHLKAFRVQTGNGPPKPNEGTEGDLTVRITKSGLRLFIKFRNKWYSFGGSGVLGIPGGANTEEVLSLPNLRAENRSTGNRGQETFINPKDKNLELGGNIKTNKGGFINRDGVSNKGLYFGRDDVDKPGQAHFDDDVFIQLGYKLYLSDGNLTQEADGLSNASWIIAPLDTVVQHIVDGNVYLELDATNTRVRLKQKALIGASGYMTIDDNEIDVSSGDLTLDVAGDIIADVAGGDFTIQDDAASKPELNIISTADSVYGPKINLIVNKGKAADDNDILGNIVWSGYNDAGTPALKTFAQIQAQQQDVSAGNEEGVLKFFVRTNEASIGGSAGKVGLQIAGSITNDEIDVSIANGAASVTAVAGNITVGGTVDGVDIAARDAVLTATTATADAASNFAISMAVALG